MSDAPKTLMTAILAVQSELPKLEKSAVNPHFKSKYISLDVLMAEVMPILNKNGLVWTCWPGFDGESGEATLEYEICLAATGEARNGVMKLLASKDDPQGQGAAITYARRYAPSAVLGIVSDEDDDGNRATASRQASRARQQEARALSASQRPLTQEERERMVDAIKAKGLDLAAVLTEAGVEALLDTTLAQAQRVKVILERDTPAESRMKEDEA